MVYDEYLIDHCWIVTCDHHLDDSLSLYHVSDDRVSSINMDVRILRTQDFAQNRPPCAEFGVLRRIEENLPNGTENAKILPFFINPFIYNG